MQNTVKPILSTAAMALFVLMAAACYGPDIATNTTVPIKDCETKATVFGHLKVNVTVVNFDGSKGFCTGKLFVTHQKVNPDTCKATFEVYKDITWSTDANGKYTYLEETDFRHDNKEDLFRVHVLGISPFQSYHGVMSDVITLKYSAAECAITLRLPPNPYQFEP